MPSSPNIWIAASDGDIVAVGKFLARDPEAVNSHDSNGYTPIHAAASYNHLSLLRSLVKKHGGDVDLQDAEGDTPLFVAETVEAARVLVEELGADVDHRNSSGLTAADAIEEDGLFPLVAAYLRSLQTSGAQSTSFPDPPTGVSVDLSAVDDTSETLPPVDQALRARIIQLSAREDFNSEETQRELRSLVSLAVKDHILEPNDDRNVRYKREG